MVNSTAPIRASKSALEFFKKLSINRIKTGNSDESESRAKLIDIVVKFFKENNSEYLKLLKIRNG